VELLASSAFNTAFELYSEDMRKYLMAISLFPGSFDLEAVGAVLGEDRNSAYKHIHELADFNELEFDSANSRYHQNDLFRIFIAGKVRSAPFKPLRKAFRSAPFKAIEEGFV